MKIFVGSENPVKINAVVNAALETWPDIQVAGFNVPSGVSEQPRTDEETSTGALNRAKAALEDGLSVEGESKTQEEFLGVGLEGGVTNIQGELWNTVWVAVVDAAGNEFIANGARFRLPKVVSNRIEAGQEMGPVISQLVSEKNVRQKQGFIGIVTEEFVDRTEEYASIAKLALGLWYGRNWERNI